MVKYQIFAQAITCLQEASTEQELDGDNRWYGYWYGPPYRPHPGWGWPSHYTAGRFVWCDRPFYLVKQPQEKWSCDYHDDALVLPALGS